MSDQRPDNSFLCSSFHVNFTFSSQCPIPHKNHRNSGALGPSLSISVGTSLISNFLPNLWSLLLLSNIMNKLKSPANKAPVAPKAAVVANAGIYFGADPGVKILLETRPMTLARGTPIDVRTTLRPSWGSLLLYQVESRTLGALVPQHIIKVAKSTSSQNQRCPSGRWISQGS